MRAFFVPEIRPETDMFNCIALYRGKRFSDLELVTLCADRQIVAEFVKRLLAKQDTPQDRALAERRAGVRRALRVIAGEVHDE